MLGQQALASLWDEPVTGDGSTPSLPQGTVTFLLTDIERSTRAWEHGPAQMSVAVARHYVLLDEAIVGHGGVRPVEQGEGDSVVGAFARASDAVAAALAAQRALVAEPWPDGAAISVRMAVHTDEAELRDAGNYFGLAVIRCARLRAIAHGGQILVSTTTADLVSEHLPADASLVDLGAHRLRDLGRAERVWQLSHADLPSGYEPLRSLDVLPNNLPMQLTTFVGRRLERRELQQLLPTTRLLSLTGAGGCGKTRLSLQLAADALDLFEGGAWFVELAAVTEPDRVVATVAAGLGERDLSGDLLDVIVGRLRGPATLVLLDNCEHLLDPVSGLADTLLRRCPELTIVATSREPLGVPGETAWRVPSLALAAREAGSSAIAEHSDAVRLFVDRAAKVRPNFRLTADNASVVRQICHRLDGIPLAIELAAARVRSMTVEQLAHALDDRFRLLTGGARTVLPRQQTLQASVDWSYGLLSDAGRAVFRRLTIFTGGFTLDAAEHVVTGDGVEATEVLDHLLALVDKSMIVTDDVGRYGMLETLRQYGAARLLDAGETVMVRNLHLAWVTALCFEDGPPSAFMWMVRRARRVETELDNFRAAFEWAVAGGAGNDAQLIARDLLIWGVSGQGSVDEAIQIGSRALALGGAPPDTSAVTASWLVWAQYSAGAHHEVEELRDRVVHDLAQVDQALVRYHCLHLLAMTSIWMPHRAMELFAEAADAAQESGVESARLQSSSFLAMAHALVGDHAPSRAAALDARAITDPDSGMQLHLHLAVVAGDTGRFEDARQLLGALETKASTSVILLRAGIAAQLVSLDLAQGRDSRSLALADAVLAEARPRRLLRVVGIVGWAQGAWALTHGDVDEAAQRLIEWRVEAPEFIMGVATTAYIQGLLAVGQANQAHDAVTSIRSLPPRGLNDEQRLLHLEGLLARAAGGLAAAEALHHKALVLQRTSGWRPGLTHTFEALAGLAACQDSPVEAARLAGAAQRLRDEMGYVLRWPFEQRLLDADVADARGSLGGDAFDAAFADARRLEPDDAVAFAARARGKRRRPLTGLDSLTPTERRVAELAVAGLTNQQIGAQLLMGAETVKSHLSRVYDKLHVRSRNALRSVPGLREPHDPDT